MFNDSAFSATWQSTNTDTMANTHTGTHSSIHSLCGKMQRTLIPLVLGSDRCSKSQEIGQGADLAGPGGVMQGRPTQGVLFIQHVGNPWLPLLREGRSKRSFTNAMKESWVIRVMDDTRAGGKEALVVVACKEIRWETCGWHSPMTPVPGWERGAQWDIPQKSPQRVECSYGWCP